MLQRVDKKDVQKMIEESREESSQESNDETTPAVSQPAVLPDGHVQLLVESIYSTTCIIQISADLRGWIPLGPAVSQGDGRWTYTDEAPPQSGARFYRAVGE